MRPDALAALVRGTSFRCQVSGARCYVLCVMYDVVQGFYDSYMPYVVQNILNALVIPYMVIIMGYIICVMCYVLCGSRLL